ncbi:MAG: hypothetical protein F6K26_14850 [Moorea sp. SIO2I5]|nr:hypothetical protein [Moorena sp. SIO2I5]
MRIFDAIFPTPVLMQSASGGNSQDRAASLLPTPYSLLPTPCSLFPVAYSLSYTTVNSV